jgi:hypothetical protein
MDIELKSMTPVSSVDRKAVKLIFRGQGGETADIVMSIEHFRGTLATLIEFQLQNRIEEALPDTNPETEIPSRDHTLLIAKNLDVARWEGGGCILQLQTTLDAGFQIGLTPKMMAFLRHALSAQLS